MIIAGEKPIPEILAKLRREGRVLVAGCNGCTAVCHVGGEKEARLLAQALRLAAKVDGRSLTVDDYTVTRQCEPEYIEELRAATKGAGAVVSVACGVGVQMIAEYYPDLAVLPGVDTTFYGTTVEHGVWEERCQGCGACILGETFGLCPIARCAKSLLNGPCGGSQQGWCEVGGKTVPCIWDMIVRRALDSGRGEELARAKGPKDWSPARDGGQRRRVRDDLRIPGAAAAMHAPQRDGMPNTHRLPEPPETYRIAGESAGETGE